MTQAYNGDLLGEKYRHHRYHWHGVTTWSAMSNRVVHAATRILLELGKSVHYILPTDSSSSSVFGLAMPPIFSVHERE